MTWLALDQLERREAVLRVERHGTRRCVDHDAGAAHQSEEDEAKELRARAARSSQDLSLAVVQALTLVWTFFQLYIQVHEQD